jgi:hypothetical protein
MGIPRGGPLDTSLSGRWCGEFYLFNSSALPESAVSSIKLPSAEKPCQRETVIFPAFHLASVPVKPVQIAAASG